VSRDATPLDVLERRADWCVVCGDCRDVMPTLPPGVFDSVTTDEPYAIPKGSAFVRRGGRDVEECGEEDFNALVPGWIALAAPLVMDGGYLSTFTAEQRKKEVEADMAAQGLVPWRPFYIVKTAPAPTPRPGFMSAVEVCVISYKGKRRWFGGGSTSNAWIGLTPNRLNNAVHDSEKPVEAMAQLLRALVPVGGVVLDCFAGSGTTGDAALRLGMRVVLIEKSEKNCELCRERLEGAAKGMKWLGKKRDRNQTVSMGVVTEKATLGGVK